MRKAFIDGNILVAVLNKEYPLFRTAARVLSLAEQSNFELYTSPTCLAIAFYFAEKKNGTDIAMQKIKLLASHIKIAGCGQKEVQAVLGNKQIADFEDGLQYYAALNAGCDTLITEDLEDFHFASVPVLNSENYLRQIALPMIKMK